MKKLLKYIILVVVFGGFAFGYSHIDKMHAIYNEEVDADVYVNTGILLNETIEQEIVCQEDSLSGISLKCATFGERKNAVINWFLYRENGMATGNGTILGEEFSNNKFYTINTGVISDCKGEHLKLVLEFAGGGENDGLCLYIEPETKGKTFVRNGDKSEGTLIMRTVTHRFDWETFFVVLIFEVYLIGFIKVMYKLFK